MGGSFAMKISPIYFVLGLAADAFGECAMADLATRSGRLTRTCL